MTAEADDEKNRRHELRREGDRLVVYRVDELERDVVRLDSSLQMLGSSTAHLALLDARSDENTRRITELEKATSEVETLLTNLRVALENVRTKVVMFSAAGSLIGAGAVAVLARLAGS